MKIQLPFVLKVQVAFGAVMAVLLVVGIVACRSVLGSADSARWAQHTNEVLEHLANLRSSVESIENGYRDFALSGADAYLQRSRASTSLADNEQGALRALTVDNPRQLRLLGCDEMQGYLFGRPVPVESFEQKYMLSSPSA